LEASKGDLADGRRDRVANGLGNQPGSGVIDRPPGPTLGRAFDPSPAPRREKAPRRRSARGEVRADAPICADAPQQQGRPALRWHATEHALDAAPIRPESRTMIRTSVWLGRRSSLLAALAAALITFAGASDCVRADSSFQLS